MKSSTLRTTLFLDSGDPEDTKKIISLMGFLDGQTTNPSLVAKKLTASGNTIKLSSDGLLFEYRKIIEEISRLIPDGSVSIEVYADNATTSDEMLTQGRQMFIWVPNAHIKYPTTSEGLKAAEQSIREGMRVNMTLVFSLEQAAAVYVATKGAKKGDVFISPFIGRLDDRGENGMDLIKNIAELYKRGDGHVEILSASIRSINHVLGSIASGADILTCPKAILEEWANGGMKLPDEKYVYDTRNLRPIAAEPLNLNAEWNTFDISHSLTETGLSKFASDWNALIEK